MTNNQQITATEPNKKAKRDWSKWRARKLRNISNGIRYWEKERAKIDRRINQYKEYRKQLLYESKD